MIMRCVAVRICLFCQVGEFAMGGMSVKRRGYQNLTLHTYPHILSLVPVDLLINVYIIIAAASKQPHSPRGLSAGKSQTPVDFPARTAHLPRRHPPCLISTPHPAPAYAHYN